MGQYVVPATVMIALRWNLTNGKISRNVMHASVAGGFASSAAVAQAIYAAIIASAAWTAYKPFVNQGNSLAGVDLRDLRSLNQPVFPSTGAVTPGTGVAAEVPQGTALCVTLKTNLAGRANRGRVYLPGLDTTAVVAATGAINVAANTAAVNFITAVQTAFSASSATLAIWVPPRNGYTSIVTGTVIPARPAASPNTVTTITTRSTTFRSQRRRQLRV